MNLALANAELASGFAIAEENRKAFAAASEQNWNGFVAALHDALLRTCFTHKDASRRRAVNDLIVTLSSDFYRDTRFECNELPRAASGKFKKSPAAERHLNS